MGEQKEPRVALFLPSLRGGGAEKVIFNLAHGFAQRGYEVDLVLQKAEGTYLSELPEKVRLIDLQKKRMALALLPLFHYFRRERPGALLSAMTHTNIIAIVAARLAKANTRIVVSAHGPISISSRNARFLRGRYLYLIAKWIYPWADAVIAVSQGVADNLIQVLGLPKKKVEVIYNPVVTPELLARAEEPLEHPWFATGEPPVVLSVGRLTQQKDYPTLIRAFALVCKERSARLMILGEGEDRPKLEALIQKLGVAADVALPGFVDNPYKYMKTAAVFVLSSRWEGFGNVLVEAMAVGTPVISTDCRSGPAEILEDGRWGHLVTVGNAEKMAKSIISVLEGDKIDARLRSLAFSADHIVDEYARLLGFRTKA